jgi:PAS domain S-box-containing protein
MGTSFGLATSVLAAVATVAGVVAVALAVLTVGLLRRSVRRLTSNLEELRRHPLVGVLPAENEPELRPFTTELNHLLEDLRARLQDNERRTADIESFAAGPPDLALIGTDSDWGVTFFSRGAVLLLGWAAEEIAGRHVEALFGPGEWDRVLPKLARRSLREAGLSEMLRLQRRDGTVFAAQVSIAGASGDGGSMLLAARDLTVDQDRHAQLRESEERYRGLVEGMGDGVFILQDDRIVYANPALARITGTELETLRGAPLARLVHSHDLLRVLETLRHARSGAEPAGEVRCLLSSRGPRPLEVRLAWARATFQGKPALVGTVTDVSDRAGFERALAESQARLAATLESAGDGLLMLEETGGELLATVVNGVFCRLWKVSPEDLIGRSAGEIARRLGERSDTVALERFMQDARSDRKAHLEGLEIKEPRALVDLLAGRLVDATSERPGLILTVRDVTQRIESEKSLRATIEELSRAKAEVEAAHTGLASAKNELAERNGQLEALNAELRSLDEMKSGLLANVSHELHTPLVSIKGYTEMILKRRLGPLTPEQERGLGVALKNIDRLIEMIDNLLSFSRIEKGETQLHLEDVPLWQVVDEAIEMVGERMRKKNLSVTTEYETDELTVRGDRVKIGQVMVNLLTNAVKFNNEGGRITLTVRKGGGGFLEVDVADTGVGIPQDALEKIFERFYQADATPRRKYEGTGIGLSIVRDILRLHGCTIRVTSQPGQGSVFTFTLPLSREQEPSAPHQAPGRGKSRDTRNS